MSSMQEQAQDAMRSAGAGAETAAREAGRLAQDAIDRIPPDAWPIIDQSMRILTVVTIVWLVLALVAWWRRRAYNLTVAASARRNKKARPEFLKVDKKAREAALARGEAYEEALEEREAEEARAVLRAAAGPVGWLEHIARLATLAMSIFTLITGFTGAIFNVTRVGDYLEQAGTEGKLEYLITEYPLGCTVAVLVIAYNIWRYFAEKKWKKED
ncbi:hypothetical protein [Aurantiacibacter flavus]|uniref:MotA/TolQ/ExbB proton channel domain-containing protein n=1 Tax=Aurantiacibacter flavus TaxID=3145232 RepID=A0ABV0CS25_9SPHN